MTVTLRNLTSLALAALAFGLASPAGRAQEIELIPTGPLTYDQNTGETVATGGAQLLYDSWILSADTIRYNQETGEASATGNVVFSRADLRLTADSLLYQPEKEFARAINFRAGNGRAYVDGSRLEGNPNHFRFHDVNFYPGEPGTFLFVARAGELSLIDQSEVRGKRLFFKVGAVPFLLIPNITQPLDAETNLFKPTLDYSGHIGAAIGAEALVPVSSNVRLGGNVALTSKRGILAGPAGSYSFRQEDSQASGSLISGYIKDQGEPGLDLDGLPIDDERYFAQWKHRQSWGDNRASLSSYLRYWSDSEVTRDFYEDSFDEMQNPDSYLEANYNGNNWQASLFTRAALNDFQAYTERLPELRFTYFPTPLGHGVSHSGFLSAARLKNDDGVADFDGAATRLDAFYGLDYHKPLRDGLSLRLKAGARGVRYQDADYIVGYHTATDPDTNETRPDFSKPITQEWDGETAFADIGADLRAKAYSTTEFKNETWNISGIRHIVEPVLSYRYTPRLESSGLGRNLAADRLPIPDFDLLAFNNYLSAIDLEDRRDVDNLREDHKLRFELRNRIQTRNREGATRNLARVTLASDYYLKGSSYGENEFSFLHLDLSVTPADWLEVGLFTRVDPEDSFAERETNARIVIQDQGYWRVGFGSHFLKGLSLGQAATRGISSGYPYFPQLSRLPLGPELNDYPPDAFRLEQYYAFFDYQFSENFKLYATARYDSETGVFYEQRIGIMQRALERYGLKYELRIYDGARRETDFGISLGIDLFDE